MPPGAMSPSCVPPWMLTQLKAGAVRLTPRQASEPRLRMLRATFLVSPANMPILICWGVTSGRTCAGTTVALIGRVLEKPWDSVTVSDNVDDEAVGAADSVSPRFAWAPAARDSGKVVGSKARLTPEPVKGAVLADKPVMADAPVLVRDIWKLMLPFCATAAEKSEYWKRKPTMVKVDWTARVTTEG